MLVMTQKVYEDSPAPFSGSFPEKSTQHIFKILPKDFTMTDYNIHIKSTSDEFSKVAVIRASISDLIQAQALKPHTLVKVMTTDSLQEMYDILEEEFQRAEEENNKLAQTEKALKDLETQNKDLTNKIKKFDEVQQALDKAKLQLESWKAEKDYEIDKESNSNTKEFNNKKIELQERTVDLEALQLELGTGREREVKNLNS
jgi:superfamily II DNA or RNA helicase